MQALDALLQSPASAHIRTLLTGQESDFIKQHHKFHLPKQFTENSSQWFHLNFKKKKKKKRKKKKAQVNSSPGEAHSWDTKPGVCYQPRSPKVSCKWGLPRNSEVLVLSEDQNVSWERHPGPPGLVSKESCFKPHLTHTNLTLEMLLQEQNYGLKGKQR